MDSSSGGRGPRSRRGEGGGGQHPRDHIVNNRLHNDQRLRTLGDYNHNNYMATGNAFYQQSNASSRVEVSLQLSKTWIEIANSSRLLLATKGIRLSLVLLSMIRCWFSVLPM